MKVPQSEGLAFETRAVRAGSMRSAFGEHSEAIFLTSSFVCENAAQAAAVFAGDAEGFVYSRAGNPTNAMFEARLASLEAGEACISAASGMAAIQSTVMALAGAGDHLVVSTSVFGATVQLFTSILPRFGIETTWVSLTDPQAWADAIRPNTRMLFLETPSNPLMEVADLAALSKVARAAGVPLVVDNCICTPALQRPLEQGADIVIHSATKYLDGQGRVLGGAVVGSSDFIDGRLRPMLRTTGAVMSPFNAWIMLRGMETLSLRVRQQSANALVLARLLAAHPQVRHVYYPGLENHPQFELAAQQQTAAGAVLSFELRADPELAGSSGDAATEVAAGGQAGILLNRRDAELRMRAWRVIDACELVSITANLGDTRSTITHPATTTHGRITPAARAAAGIGQGLMRVAVGLEDPQDLYRDLLRGLDPV
jgi:O-succinylhomoserine sulfhydrylase